MRARARGWIWRGRDIYSVRRRSHIVTEKRTILTRGYLLQVDADEWRDALGVLAAIIGPPEIRTMREARYGVLARSYISDDD